MRNLDTKELLDHIDTVVEYMNLCEDSIKSSNDSALTSEAAAKVEHALLELFKDQAITLYFSEVITESPRKDVSKLVKITCDGFDIIYDEFYLETTLTLPNEETILVKIARSNFET